MTAFIQLVYTWLEDVALSSPHLSSPSAVTVCSDVVTFWLHRDSLYVVALHLLHLHITSLYECKPVASLRLPLIICKLVIYVDESHRPRCNISYVDESHRPRCNISYVDESHRPRCNISIVAEVRQKHRHVRKSWKSADMFWSQKKAQTCSEVRKYRRRTTSLLIWNVKRVLSIHHLRNNTEEHKQSADVLYPWQHYLLLRNCWRDNTSSYPLQHHLISGNCPVATSPYFSKL